MGKLLTFLSGKKTYIFGAALFICGGLEALGYKVPEGVMVALAGAMGVSLRAAVNKIDSK